MTDALLEVDGLSMSFTRTSGFFGGTLEPVAAVRDVSLRLGRGETLALVGESGSGKSTLARCIVQLHHPQAGSVRFEGRELTTLRGGSLRDARRHIGIIFQDPYASLNPRWTVGRIVRDPLDVNRVGSTTERHARATELIEAVGLPATFAGRLQNELSGGERQRVAIARALALRPSLIICDEPTSSLDVSVQAQILNLLTQLQRELSVSYLFISHNLGVVRQISDRVAIMRGGRILEEGAAQSVFESPRDEYTMALLASVPTPKPAGLTPAEGGGSN